MGRFVSVRTATLILALCICFMAVQGALPAYASTVGYDATDVMEDLQGMTIDGKLFNVTDYPYSQSKSTQVVYFMEYCYSYRENMRSNYGLYVYVYNPRGLEYMDSQQNKLQLGVGNDYSKYELKLCGKTTGDYNNLFLKFKVVDTSTIGESVNTNSRSYKVSGIELLVEGDRNATEYAISSTYVFTGYAKGLGPDATAESTLTCNSQSLETITLDVKHTFYRTLTSSKGAGYQNQLDTVYFAVPKRFFENYGTLQRIKAEWYEYKTNDIVVTSNQDFYNAASSYLGVKMATEYNKEVGYSLGQDAGDWGGGFHGARWGWNLGTGYLHPACERLTYLFKVNDISNYDPYADVVSIGGVESNALYEYIFNYSKTFVNGKLPVKDGKISADLFAADIDEYRKMNTAQGKIQQGYSYYDFDADVDLQKLSAWSETQPSFWDNWLNFGLWNAVAGQIPTETGRTVSPIYTLKASDLTGTNEEVAERLLINSSDVTKLKSFASSNTDKVVVLFRFATTDYFSVPIDIMQLGQGFLWSDKYISGQAYRAWESVFLDFDIIQLSFTKDGSYTVIPVVANPIDIVNAVTPPLNIESEKDWWKIIIAVVLLILLLIVLAPILPYVIQGVIWLVCLPFRAIAALVRKRKDKDK